MESSRNIPKFNIPGTLFWEYSPEFHRELFPNIPGIYHGYVPRIFHEHIFARWVVFPRLRNSENLLITVLLFKEILILFFQKGG